jgi:hypothetical protein
MVGPACNLARCPLLSCHNKSNQNKKAVVHIAIFGWLVADL